MSLAGAIMLFGVGLMGASRYMVLKGVYGRA